MEEFLSRLDAALDAGDFKEIDRLGRGFLYICFMESLDKQLTGTAYFPDLNPDFSKAFNRKKSKSTRQKEAIDRIKKDPTLILKSQCDWQGIEEITDYEFITLFETALLIGHRIDKEPRSLLPSCPALFMEALIKKELDPRHPRSFIPYSKLPESPKAAPGGFIFGKDSPDLSWMLTPREAATFAILKGYPEHLFSDLLSDTPEESKPTPYETQAKEPDDSGSKPMKANTEPDKSLDQRERQTLLAIIAALCKKQGISPCDRGLAGELEKLTELLATKRSAKTIKEHLDKAGQLFE